MPLAHALLAFLNEQPLSGYDLKKLMDVSVGQFWTSTQSHIYKALGELQQKGWAIPQVVEQSGKPNRNEYHITPSGREELHEWLVTPLPPSSVREGWMIQLYFSQDLSNAQITAQLEARLHALDETLAVLESIQEQVDKARAGAIRAGLTRAFVLRSLTLDYGKTFYQNEQAWLRHAIRLINEMEEAGQRTRN